MTTTTPTPTVEIKLVEMLDALQNGAVQVGEKIVQYSPDIADAALTVVRLQGLQEVITGIACMLVLYMIIRWAIRLAKWSAQKQQDEDREIGLLLGGIGLCLPGVYSLLQICDLISIWTWVAVFEPKLWLAKHIIDSTLGK